MPRLQGLPQTSFLFLKGHQVPDAAAERYGAEVLDPVAAPPTQIVEQLLVLIFHRKL